MNRTSSPALLPPATGSRRRSRIALTVIVAAALTTGMASAPSSALGGSGPTPQDAVAAARTGLDRARQVREEAESRLAGLRVRKDQLQGELSDLDRSDAALTNELADARRQVREFAVAAYIDGGRTEMMRASLSPEQASALSWSTGLVSGQAGSASDAADRFDALRSANDPDRVAAAVELDRLTTKESEAFSDLLQASALERDADAQVTASNQRAASAAARDQARPARATAAATTTAPAARPDAPAPKRRATRASARASARAVMAAPVAPVGTGGTGDSTGDEQAFLAQVRRCESKGDYGIVSSTGRYRGAYQFSVQTWQGVGGSGDPAAASPAEQDQRALALLRLQGKRAWPVCSR